METVGVDEAKTHLARLLKRAAGGAGITITEDSLPAAFPQPADTAMLVREAIARLKDFRKGRRLEGLSLRETIAEGRA